MKDFKETKAKILAKLSECKGKVEQLEQLLNIDLTDTKEKIDRTRADIEKEQLKIVLFGAFSDGKSTVISVLLGRTDIKIAPEPTTDKIATYEYDDFFIVDTPGLFSEKTEHDELTRKYISEADLIIFTTDAVNPLKQSQHQTIKWILRDLDKLNQTIFIINKIDTTGIDIEDPKEFKTICEVKRKVVIDTLNEIMETSMNSYSIVCLSADPYGMGIDYWLSNKEEYEKLSNIKELDEMIEKIIKENKYILMLEKARSVLKDIAFKNKEELYAMLNRIQEDLKKISLNYRELEEEVNNINTELSKASTRIKRRLVSYREEIISQLQTCADFSCLKEVVDRYIGTKSNILRHEIELIFKEELEPVYKHMRSAITIMEQIENFYNTWDETLLNVIRGGSEILKYAGKVLGSTNTAALRTAILRARDFLSLPVKFKPWEALKLAKSLQYLAVMADIVDIIVKVVSRIFFENKQRELIENIDLVFKEVLEKTNEDDLKEAFFEPLIDLEMSLHSISEDIADKQKAVENIKKALLMVSECQEASNWK